MSVSWQTIAFSGLVGLFVGVFAMLLTLAVYTTEDLFHRLKKVHWMWWPAMGGVVIGVGGLIQPRALGISADVIEGLLKGNYVDSLFVVLLPLLLVKAVIWSTSLGSGTSGGVLAPLLMIGGGVGLFAGSILSYAVGPGWLIGDDRVWALAGMAAMMGGAMRAPLTGTIFALELTHDINTFPALLIGLDRLLRLHRAGDEALDPDGEGGPPRLPHQLRILRGSAGDGVGARGDDGRRW